MAQYQFHWNALACHPHSSGHGRPGRDAVLRGDSGCAKKYLSGSHGVPCNDSAPLDDKQELPRLSESSTAASPTSEGKDDSQDLCAGSLSKASTSAGSDTEGSASAGSGAEGSALAGSDAEGSDTASNPDDGAIGLQQRIGGMICYDFRRRCPHCQRLFPNAEALKNHDNCMEMRSELGDAFKSGNGTIEGVGIKLSGNFHCAVCSQTFDSEKALSLHCKYTHDECPLFNFFYTPNDEFGAGNGTGNGLAQPY